MANENINIKMLFNADTSKAKKALNELEISLHNIAKLPGSGETTFDDTKIRQASKSALELEQHLRNAFNVKTGNLDLSRFSSSLSKSKKTLTDYRAELSLAGTEGNKAFLKLAESITYAEKPILRINQTMSNFLTTLKNTAKWQISSSIIHGFMGSLQKAYGYAQDLNESLNSIRIVTGQSTDQMADFAAKANKAAKELGTTTTAYTDAALIFYQQGLTGDAVTDRTDTVIKMANVTGQSAEEVSSYMTAIWNNFDDGSESLEHYADVITALGAHTASSSAEIAEGLEKFASIGSTVGLSYEYATAALATVVAQTRQSADTVGTAFKTLFARIQDLELGETLDDGTSLGKYSQALMSIGINIKDANGQVKDMNTILDEMGSKWNTISKDTQIAVAQTVAGTRQYSQLMALMANYDKFKENVSVAEDSDNTLENQAKIYEESWEGAQKHVRASMEEIYSDLIDDQFFIDLTNGLAKVIEAIDGIAKSFGGLGGIFTAVASIFTSKFVDQIPKAMGEVSQFIKTLSGQSTKEMIQMQQDANAEVAKIQAKETANGSLSGEDQQRIENIKQMSTLQTSLLKNAGLMSEKQLEQKQLELDNLKVMQDELVLQQKKLDTAKQIAEEKEKEVRKNLESKSTLQQLFDEKNAAKQNVSDTRKQAKNAIEIVNNSNLSDEEKAKRIDSANQKVSDSKNEYEEKYNTLKQYGQELGVVIQKTTTIDGAITSILKKYKSVVEETKKYNSESADIDEKVDQWEEDLKTNKKTQAEINKEIKEYVNLMQKAGKLTNVKLSDKKDEKEQYSENLATLKNTSQEDQSKASISNDLAVKIEEAIPNVKEYSDAMEDVVEVQQKVADGSANTAQEMERIGDVKVDGIKILGDAMQGVVSGVSAAQMSLNGFKTLFDENTTGAQKLGAALTVLTGAMQTYRAISSIVMATKKLQVKAEQEELTFKTLLTAITKKKSVADTADAATNQAVAVTEGEVAAGLVTIEGLLGPILIVTLAVTAAFAAFTAISQHHSKALKEQAEHEKALLDIEQKKLDSLKETQENLNSLSNAYDELIEKNKKGEMTDKELQNQVYDLCMQYGEEELAIKALCGAYKDLAGAISGLEEANAEELAASAERTQRRSKTTAIAAMKSYAREQLGGSAVDGSDDKYLDVDVGDNLRDTVLSKYGIDEHMGGKVEFEQLFKAYSENGDQFIKDLEEENSEAANKIIDVLNSAGTEFDSYQDAGKTKIESEAIGKYKNINSQEQYDSAMDEIIADTINNGQFANTEEGKEKARDYARNLLAGINDEFQKYANSNSLAKMILDSSNGKYSQADVEKAIGNLPESLRNAIGTNTDIFADMLDHSDSIDEAVENFRSKFQSVVDLQKNDLLSSNLKAGITKGSALDMSEVNSLYESGFNGVSKDEFLHMDYETQKAAMIDYYATVQQKSVETAQIVIDNLTKEREELQKNYYSDLGVEDKEGAQERINNNNERLQRAADTLNNDETYRNMLKDAGIDAISPEDLADILLGEASDEYSEEIQQKIKGILSGKRFDLNDMRNVVKINKDYEKTLSSINDTLGVAQSVSVDYDTILEGHQSTLESLNKSLDTLQSSYKTLKSAEEEYNQNGFITADTYQSLLALSPEYVNQLFDEQGNLKLNKEAFIELTKAKYDDLAATQLKIVADELQAAAGDAAKMAAIEQKYVLDAVKDSTYSAAEAQAVLTKQIIAASDASATAKENMNKYVDSILKMKDAAMSGATSQNFDKAIGASSGSKKQKETKDLKKYDDEFDRYHDIKEVLEEVADAISDVEKRQKHLYGKELANSLKQENALLEQQKSCYQQLAAEQKAEQSELMADLSAAGVQFDSTTGQIVNYAAATAQALQDLNDAITKYNASSQTEADKKLLEAAQKNYDEVKKKLDRYDKLIEEIRDTENKLDDLWYKEKENNLKAWEAEIKVELDLNDVERKWNKFVNKMNKDFKSTFKDIKNDLKGMAEEANKLANPSGNIEKRMSAMSQIEAEIDKMMAGGESDMFVSVSEAQEKLKEYMNDLQSDVEDLYDLYVSAWDGYIEGIEQAIDKFDDLNSQFERLNDELDHQSKMIELLYGEQAYDLNDQLYNAQQENQLAQMESTRKQIDYFAEEYQRAVSEWGEDSEAAIKWKESYETALSSLNAQEEKYIETIQKKAINSIQKIKDETEKALTGGKSLSFVQEQWDIELKSQDGKYDDVEKVYQIDKLENAYQKAIGNTKSTKAQQQLAKYMQDQVSALEEKTELTEYDIELAEKRLAIYEAQIALEDAQNNKNAMKLTRGEDGNWSYQYVADEGELQDKQQNLLDKQYEAYEFVKQKQEEITSQILENTEWALERIAELEQAKISASAEEVAAIDEQIAFITEKYWGDNGIITSDIKQSGQIEQDLNQETANLLWTLYDTDETNFERMNANEQALIEELKNKGVQNYGALYDAVIGDYEGIKIAAETVNKESLGYWDAAAKEIIRKWNGDDGASVKNQIDKAVEECKKVFNAYKDDINKGCKAAGEDFTNVGSKINDVQTATQNLKGATDELISSTCSELREYESYLRQVESAWNSVKDRAVDAMNTAISYLKKVGDQAAATIAQINSAKAAASAATTTGGGGGTGGGNGNTSTKKWYVFGVKQSNGLATKLKGPYDTDIQASQAQTSMGSTAYQMGYKKVYIAQMKKGGYTGSWNGSGDSEYNDGKLAYLHQNELVLNASDTSNILKVVDFVRNMGQNMIDNLASGIKGIGFNSNNSTTNTDNTNNIFNITAEFPNANDVTEIREAILSLPNLVSQYIGR